MGRGANRLTAKSVTGKKRPGYYADGLGLYLQVGASGSKSWLFRYMRARKAREMGLGSASKVSLAQARQKAADARNLIAMGVDPLEARKAAKAGQALEEARLITFGKCASAYINTHKADWKNAKHAEQWTNTIETYCGPLFGSLPVQSVDTGLVHKALDAIWTEKPETASRLRGRIEKVIDWATVSGYRTGENPARWRGHMDKLLPALKKKQRVRHHPALPYDDTGAFVQSLHKQDGIAALALEFTILTAARTGEVIHATRDEFDFDAAVWIVPAKRTKTGREHRVPLAPRVLGIIRMMAAGKGDYVFPGREAGDPLSSMAMLELIKRMHEQATSEGAKGWIDPKCDDERITVHGFRSSFRDWAAERTNFPQEVCKMALAHTVGDEVEEAYRRGDLFEKRRRLMLNWARFCERPRIKGNVVPMRAKRN